MAHRILLVEDDAELRDMMAQLLESEGFDAEVASDGGEALRVLSEPNHRPEVILLDMMMPRMDGWEFRRRQTNDPSIAMIPVVVVTAVPRNQLSNVGAVAVLQKPVDYDELVATVLAQC